MDQIVVDVSTVPQVQVGAEVVLLGRQGREVILAAELAQRAGTISYEILTNVGARVARVYR
jgi:alanine racemase